MREMLPCSTTQTSRRRLTSPSWMTGPFQRSRWVKPKLCSKLSNSRLVVAHLVAVHDHMSRTICVPHAAPPAFDQNTHIAEYIVNL